jgi:hypothetical protein
MSAFCPISRIMARTAAMGRSCIGGAAEEAACARKAATSARMKGWVMAGLRRAGAEPV